MTLDPSLYFLEPQKLESLDYVMSLTIRNSVNSACFQPNDFWNFYGGMPLIFYIFSTLTFESLAFLLISVLCGQRQ